MSKQKFHNVSCKQVQKFIKDPRCTRDYELSTDFIDVYQLPDGGVLLPTPGEGGVVYESREDLVSLVPESEAALKQSQSDNTIDEFLPEGEIFVASEHLSREEFFVAEATRLIDDVGISRETIHSE